jgi:hypothetical protein
MLREKCAGNENCLHSHVKEPNAKVAVRAAVAQRSVRLTAAFRAATFVCDIHCARRRRQSIYGTALRHMIVAAERIGLDGCECTASTFCKFLHIRNLRELLP